MAISINEFLIVGISNWLNLVSVGWQCWLMTLVAVILLVSFVELEKLILRKRASRI
jgi:hypothetical protein